MQQSAGSEGAYIQKVRKDRKGQDRTGMQLDGVSFGKGSKGKELDY